MTADDLNREAPARLRVLFAFGLTPEFYSLDQATILELLAVLKEGYSGLKQKFDVDVLGGLDDDELVVGATSSWPWTAYILADAPDYDAVRQVAGLIRTLRVGEHRMWRYFKVEARIGRPLFFGES
ncbi:hypothetical protein ACEXQD_14190 [Herbiconiux sp. P15]|uniref:hypothetical protein n=1 Tax=Herbiconiux liukaitaii TaxID=3342799 RepID=UPI0035B9FA53